MIWCRWPGIHAHFHVVTRQRRHLALEQLHGGGELGDESAPSSCASTAVCGLLASRRESCRMLSTISLTRWRIGADDAEEAPFVLADGGRLLEQLAGVAHGADRIADLVGDAGGQPAECGELRLLHLLRQHPGILEEDQHRAVLAALQRRDVGVDLHAAVRRNEGGQLAARVVAAAPGFEQARQLRATPACSGWPGCLHFAAEVLGGRLVDQPDVVGRIHHDDALAQVAGRCTR